MKETELHNACMLVDPQADIRLRLGCHSIFRAIEGRLQTSKGTVSKTSLNLSKVFFQYFATSNEKKRDAGDEYKFYNA